MQAFRAESSKKLVLCTDSIHNKILKKVGEFL